MKTDTRMLQAREIATKLDSAADDVAAKLDHVFGGNLFDLLTEARDFLAALSTATPPVDGEAKMREALEPFARVAEHDIGDDETDGDIFRPARSHNRAPLLTVGDLRRAREALASTQTGGGE